MEPGWDEPWRGRHRSWGFDEDEDDEEPGDDVDDPDAYELGDFIDGEITLTHWVEQAGENAMPLASRVSGDEVCCSTPSSDLKPYASEYEGYVGNYGNTMDRWYRRAALVLWPRERGFAVRAEASPTWALQTLEQWIGTDEAEAAGRPRRRCCRSGKTSRTARDCDGLLGGILRAADGIALPELAASLLQPFRVEALTPEDAPALVSLTRRYGESWSRRLLSEWSGDQRRDWRLDESRKRFSWLAGLPRLCEALSGADDAVGSTVALLLLRDRWEALLRWIGEVRRPARPSLRDEAVAALSGPLLGILGGAGAIAADDLKDEVVAAVCADENEPLLPCLVQAVRTAAEDAASESRAAPALEALTRHCIWRLEARLALPARGEGDWSIAVPDGCRCALQRAGRLPRRSHPAAARMAARRAASEAHPSTARGHRAPRSPRNMAFGAAVHAGPVQDERAVRAGGPRATVLAVRSRVAQAEAPTGAACRRAAKTPRSE